MRRAALIAALALLAAAPAALAVTLRDRDDVTVGIDIAKTGGAHNRVDDQLVHTIDAYEAFTAMQMLNSKRPPSSFCIEMWTRSSPGEDQPDYEACAVPNAKGDGWKGSISRPRRQGHPVRIAAVRVEQPAGTRLVLRIDPDHLRRPRSYRWRAETNVFGSPCRAASGCQDYAPDRPDTAETRLRTPR